MIVDAAIRMRVEELSRQEWERIFHALTIVDNDGLEISAYQYLSGIGEVRLPRGAWHLLPEKLAVTDLRCFPPAPKLSYARTLDAEGYEGQAAAVRAMFEHGQGQIIAAPGKGKTEMAAAFIAGARTPTLVIVHTKDLFKQWIARISASIPGAKIGTIQGGKCDIGHVTIAMAQTLKRYLHHGRKFWQQWGCLIIDEAHHAAAETWEWVLNVCPAHYRFGFTASEKRSDGREGLVGFYIGPVINKMKFESQVPMTIVPVTTPFTTKWPAQQWSRMMSELVRDEPRNKIIADIVSADVRKGHTILVLSRQIKHLELIYAEILAMYPYNASQVKIVTGKLPTRERERLIGKLTDGSLRCILGTQLFEEGIDIPRLNRIVLAFPGTDVTVLQKVGRAARQFEGKQKAIIYDVVDANVPGLAKQYVQRRAWYGRRNNNISIGKAVRHDRPEAKERRSLRDRIQGARPRRPSTP